MPSVSYEYNKERISKWRSENPDALREINRLSNKRCYDRKKDPYLNICHIFRQILLADTIKQKN